MNATLHHSGSPASAIVLPANFTFELIGKQIPITSGTLDSTAYGPGSSEWISTFFPFLVLVFKLIPLVSQINSARNLLEEINV